MEMLSESNVGAVRSCVEDGWRDGARASGTVLGSIPPVKAVSSVESTTVIWVTVLMVSCRCAEACAEAVLDAADPRLLRGADWPFFIAVVDSFLRRVNDAKEDRRLGRSCAAS
jgi:hypothetical protein